MLFKYVDSEEQTIRLNTDFHLLVGKDRRWADKDRDIMVYILSYSNIMTGAVEKVQFAREEDRDECWDLIDKLYITKENMIDDKRL